MRLGILLCALLCGGCLRGGFAREDRGGSSADLRDVVTVEVGRDVRLDQAGADRRRADAGPCQLEGGCEECQPLQNPGCTKTCAGPSTDCDDLPEGLDPWPAACNPVVFSDSFVDTALSSWLIDHDNQPPGVSVPACGRLRFSMVAQQTRWIWARPAVWPPPALKPGALAEVRFKVPAGHWYLQLYLEAAELAGWTSPQQSYRLCELRGTPEAVAATLLNQVRASPSVAAQLEVSVPAAPGQELRLQSWITGGKAHCRVSAAAPLALTTVEAAGLAPGGGLVLATLNPAPGSPDLQVDVDWIRVFNHD